MILIVIGTLGTIILRAQYRQIYEEFIKLECRNFLHRHTTTKTKIDDTKQLPRLPHNAVCCKAMHVLDAGESITSSQGLCTVYYEHGFTPASRMLSVLACLKFCEADFTTQTRQKIV